MTGRSARPMTGPCPRLSGGRAILVTAFLTATAAPYTFDPEPLDDRDRWTDLAVLVGRAQAGDRDAFGSLVRQFERTVLSICLRRLGNPSEALELTQEVFLHVMDRLDQVREPERFAGWLRQVAARMAINRATRRVPLPSINSEILEAAAEHHHDPLEDLIARERVDQLRDGMARLKTLDRETLTAFYLQGQSLIEIAARLDAPVGTIKRRLHTARKRLKAELLAAASDPDEWSEFGDDEDAEVADGLACHA